MNDTMSQANQAALQSAAAARQATTPPRRLRDVLCLDDFEAPARRYLPRPIFGYISGGVETDAVARGNRAAFDEYEFVPRVLVDTAGPPPEDEALRAHLRSAVRHSADGRHLAGRL